MVFIFFFSIHDNEAVFFFTRKKIKHEKKRLLCIIFWSQKEIVSRKKLRTICSKAIDYMQKEAELSKCEKKNKYTMKEYICYGVWCS